MSATDQRNSHRAMTEAIAIQRSPDADDAAEHVPGHAAEHAPKSRPRSRRARQEQRPPVRPVVLGILNVTPDSFSDGGQHDDLAAAISFAEHLAESGADVVDVGGESTRPGAQPVPVEEEQRRVLPVIRELVDRGIPVSIDTMNASTAAAAVELGAVIVNDVSGGTADAAMPSIAADSRVLFITMHSRGAATTMNERAVYRDTVADVRRELELRIAALLMAGVDSDRIVIDPGIGFAKDSEQNWEVLGAIRELCGLGHPVLVGASRKRFLGDLLPAGAPMGKRDAATSVISALAAEAGAWGMRVHDVARTSAALDVWAAMRGSTVMRGSVSGRRA